jgi:hypothetical protein
MFIFVYLSNCVIHLNICCAAHSFFSMACGDGGFPTIFLCVDFDQRSFNFKLITVCKHIKAKNVQFAFSKKLELV